MRPPCGLVVPAIKEKGRYDIARFAGFIVPSIPVIPGSIRPLRGLIMLCIIGIVRTISGRRPLNSACFR